jgi:hypothetical protein
MTYIAVNEEQYHLQQLEAMESIRNKFDRTTSDEWYVRKQEIERAEKMGLPEDFISQLKKDNV